MSVHVPTPKVLRYKVGAAPLITARVIIGDAQQGGWAMGFDPSSVKKGSEPDPVPVGSAAEVKDRVLQIITTAVDVRPETNRLSATTTIAGGPDGQKSVVQMVDDGNDGDTAVFTTLVIFE
jgi:hypothetical protein